MDYTKEYKKFVTSYHFAYAFRVTVGIILPAVVLSYFDQFAAGLVASLGAMAVSTADIPGPAPTRFNTMLATTFLNFGTALLVGSASSQPVLITIIIALLCFALTIIGVYGSRINTIGFAGLIIMALSLDETRTSADVLNNGFYLLAGSVWYILLSFALFQIRPYRIIQQALGEYIFQIGDYLAARAGFYETHRDYDSIFANVLQLQQTIHEKQEMLREMIFKSRSIIRQSTTTSRTVLILLIETIDLFEKATGTAYNYQSMHKSFDGKGILQKFQQFILEMSDELHQIGLAVQTAQPSKLSKNFKASLQKLRSDFELFIDENRSPQTIEPLINMRKVMQMLEDTATRIYTLHHYTQYDKKRIKNYKLADNYDDFVTPARMNKQLLFENFSIRSATFRHSLRVSIACTAGYLIAKTLHMGHSYWVLLTILVILKPSYSLSKQRNWARLGGTILGALLGAAFLFVITAKTGLFAILLVLMLLTYSFIRTNYFLGVIFMTTYLILFFFMLDPRNILEVLENRVVDTLVGSVIAFIATYILAPSWEKDAIKNYMQTALKKSSAYFSIVAASLTNGMMDDLTYRLRRKEAFVAQANLSGGFTRMLNEPKNKQQNIKLLHQFTVLVNMLNSHIVSLADFAQKHAKKYASQHLAPVAAAIEDQLAAAIHQLEDKEIMPLEKHSLSGLKKDMQKLVDKRSNELLLGLTETETKTVLIEYKPIVDQFLYISRIADDIKKLSD